MKKTIVGLIISLMLTWFAMRHLAQPGFFSMHDDTQIGRVVVMGRALRLGQFPVRWVSDLGYGYGYPIFNFYGPLPYYVGGSFYALGISGLVSTKIIFAIGIVAAAASMYLLGRHAFGPLGGILASVLYTYAPYHAVQIYVRGAVGEFWAFAFLPIVLLGVGTKNSFITALGIFGVITSHTIMGYVVALGALVAVPFFPRLGKGLVLGLGLSAFFWLPAFWERSYTSVATQIGPTSNFLDHFVCPTQLWDSLWGFGGSAVGCIDGLSYRLGKPHILLALVGVMLWLRARGTFLRWIMVVGILSIFIMLKESQFIWSLLPNVAYIQYPWRFLMFSVLSLSILGGSVVTRLTNRPMRVFIGGVLIAAILMVYVKLFTPQFFHQARADSYETEEELRFRVSKVSDEYLPSAIVRPKNASEINRDTIEKRDSYAVKTNRETDTYAMFTFDAKNDQIIRINKAYFPGWRYKVNGVWVTPRLIDGLPYLPISAGRSTVEMRFYNTWIRTTSNAISLTTVVFLLFQYGKRKKTNS